MLVSLGGAVACAVRNANEGDIAVSRIRIDVTSKQTWDAVLIQPFYQLLLVTTLFVRIHLPSVR